MDELIARLREQFDEEGRIAQAALDESNGEGKMDELGRLVVGDSAINVWATAHIGRWHPRRALIEIELKRMILDRAERIIASFDNPAAGPWPDVSRRERSHAVETIHDLALPYANDPGFKAEWRPA